MPSSTETPDQRPSHLSIILGVAPNVETNCVGFAKTKNRRCKLPASDICGRAQASRILDEGTRLLESGADNIDQILEELVPLLLCRRQHQNQAGQLVCEWSRKVEKFRERQLASSGFLLRSPSPAPRRDSESARGYRSLAQITGRGSPGPRTHIDEIASIERDENSRSIRRSPAAPPRFSDTEQLDTPSDTISTPATAATMDQHRSHTPVISATSWMSFENNLQEYFAQLAQRGVISEAERYGLYTLPSSLLGTNHIYHGFSSRNIDHQPRIFVFESGNLRSVPQTTFSTSRSTISESNRRQSTTTSSTRSAQTRSEAETITSTSRRSARPARNPDRQHASRSGAVTRRHVEGECNICLLPLLEDESDTDRYEVEDSDDFYELPAPPRIVYEELVWCRRRCGNNFHRDCMDSWIRTFQDRFERNGRQPTCPMCRAKWVEGQ